MDKKDLKDVLSEDQIDAVNKLHTGAILVGDVGSGKTRTSLAYYYLNYPHLPLYVITTAKKRDDQDWEEEAKLFKGLTITKVDSWNNIEKYIKVTNSFVIWDEQHAAGSGKWGRAFIKISKNNKWITLSATPADKYEDLMCHMIANGWYRGFTDFKKQHFVYCPYITSYPKIERYSDTGKLEALKRKMYVIMKDKRTTVKHDISISCGYDRNKYRAVWKERWNVWEDKPIENVSELFVCVRRCVNEHPSRLLSLHEIYLKHNKVIVFYCFDYELDAIKEFLDEGHIKYSEFNGHKHEAIPTGDSWVYLVQYFNSEAWNCIETDTMVFYSQTYSYKTMKQAAGRIDRTNTPFVDLYFYHFESPAPIDLAIKKALKNKKNFNESRYYKMIGGN